jgi:hypothetical protein
MPPLQKTSFIDSREAFPGVIKVTPVPIETPILTRPVLQSRPLGATVNTTLTFTSSKTLGAERFNWGAFTLFIFLAATLGLILSNVGWRYITGQIWKRCSGWDGPLEEEDEEELLAESQLESSSPKDETLTNVAAIPSPPQSTDPEQLSPEEWIMRHPREI